MIHTHLSARAFIKLGTAMKSNLLLPGALLAFAAWSMPICARASVVLDDSVGFIKGTQIFSDTFDITAPGVLTVSLSAIPWLDTLQDLTSFLTSPSGGVLPGTFNGNVESWNVLPGDITVNWYGTAAGTFGVGVYGMQVALQTAAPVPIPAQLPLLISGLGVLSLWRRSRRPARPVG
jgi:hypothetical protein